MNWLSYIGVGFSVLTAIGNIIILLAVKFNDLKHVQADLTETKNKTAELDKRIDNIGERLSKIEGKCAANHK